MGSASSRNSRRRPFRDILVFKSAHGTGLEPVSLNHFLIGYRGFHDCLTRRSATELPMLSLLEALYDDYSEQCRHPHEDESLEQSLEEKHNNFSHLNSFFVRGEVAIKCPSS